jgi:hypothetical protein
MTPIGERILPQSKKWPMGEVKRFYDVDLRFLLRSFFVAD